MKPRHAYRCTDCGALFGAGEQARYCPVCGEPQIELHRKNAFGSSIEHFRSDVDFSSPESVLHAADGDLSVIRFALENGADPNCATDAYSFLHLAARENDMELIRRLVEMGADVNCTNDLEETPLHWAIYNGCREAGELLYDLGADPSMRESDGLYPADMVEEMRADIDNLYDADEAERDRAVERVEAMADLVARLGFPRA
jgi:ankyrin repeat protein